jgi:ElaB/YqjD/DUF883 family membrane-anchored ribosome-binding protein
MDIKDPIKDATSTGKRTVDSAAGDLQRSADTATKRVGAVTDNLQRAVDQSLADQPYTTLLMAAAAGFVIGAIWKS